MDQQNAISKNVFRHAGKVSAADREALLRQKGAALWFTGLSASGKSTIAYALERKLTDAGHLAFTLDGDNIRHGLNRDLGFSAEDRTENIRRVAEVAGLFADAGALTLVSFISPYAALRENARNIIGTERFLEIFVDAPLETCAARDPKGLYVKALAGEIPAFTGVNDPYEKPEKPDLRIDTATMTVETAVEALMTLLRRRRHIS